MPTKPKNQKIKPQQQSYEIENFAAVMGMDTREARDAIQPGFWSWLMNFQPIGRRTLRVMNGQGETIYAASGGLQVLWFYNYTIAGTPYVIAFMSDGSAYQINISTAAVTGVAVAGTFWAGSGFYPHATSWSNKGILIVSITMANGYWAWDGTTLYAPGGPAPTWLYPAGNPNTDMPTGITGLAITVYQSMVWIANGRNLIASAPQVGTDFSTSDGGVNFTATDPYVQQGYFALTQLDGYLYLHADSGVDVISNVSTSGSPPTTTFLRTNVDPKIGTTWRDTVVQTPTSILFTNAVGVFEVAGGATKKVSDFADGIFEDATLPTWPTAFVAHLSEVICYGVTVQVTDPDTAATIYGVLMWDGQRWFLGSQQDNMLIVGGRDNASVLEAWACDTINLFPAFTLASASLGKKAKSWFSTGKSGITMRKQITRIYAQYAQAEPGSALASLTVDCDTATGSQSIEIPNIVSTGIITFVNNSGGALQFQNNSSQDIYFTTNQYPLIAGTSCEVICLLFGLTLDTTVATLDVVGLACMYHDYSVYA